MYGIFTYIWLVFKVKVGKYTIHHHTLHGCYGKCILQKDVKYTGIGNFPTAAQLGWNHVTHGDHGDRLIKLCNFQLIWKHVGVSKNRGTQKWMVYNGKPY